MWYSRRMERQWLLRTERSCLYSRQNTLWVLKTDDGTEFLPHIGVDTVKLDGQGFEVFVKDGQRVRKGDRLMKSDLQYIRDHAASDACMAVFTGLKEARRSIWNRRAR